MNTPLPNIAALPAPRGAKAVPAASVARRDLLQQYKESRPRAGVFSLTNLLTCRVYVGGSLNVDGAMNRMRFEPKMRAHCNKLLQKDWIAQGAETFSFKVLDQIRERDDPSFDYASELDAMLQLWREEIPCHGDCCYNVVRP